MAGLVPGHPRPRLHQAPLIAHECRMQGGWVYIMTNRPNGTLYVGVTGDLVRRIWEHREGVVEGFTKRYALNRVVYVERHEDIRSAIQREKNIKHWPRAWKIRLILQANPTWDDLYDRLASVSWMAGTSPAMTERTAPPVLRSGPMGVSGSFGRRHPLGPPPCRPHALKPPSTLRVQPVMLALSGEARKAISAATSSAVP